jgi:hypothetical protein
MRRRIRVRDHRPEQLDRVRLAHILLEAARVAPPRAASSQAAKEAHRDVS